MIADTFEAHGAALDRIHAGKDDIAEILAQNIRLTVRMVDHDPIWGWFAVRTGLVRSPSFSRPSVAASRGTCGGGFDAGRFASYDEHTTVAAFGGALLGVMRAKLETGLAEGRGPLPGGAAAAPARTTTGRGSADRGAQAADRRSPDQRDRCSEDGLRLECGMNAPLTRRTCAQRCARMRSESSLSRDSAS